MRIIVFILGVLSFSIAFSQNVGISNGIITPDVSAGLEVRYTNKGVLMPRVALTSVTDAATIPTPANSLFVYNTGAGGLVPAGYYYNEGTTFAPKWVRVANGTSLDDAWQLLGNAGTNPATNFLGTTDAQPLVFRTNNTERARFQTDGTLSIGTTADNSSNVYNRIENTDASTYYNEYNYHYGAYTGSTYTSYNFNASTTNGSKYGLYTSINSTGTGTRYGIYNSVYQNSASNSGAYGMYNYLSSYGSSINYGLYSSHYTYGTGTHYGLYNYLYISGSTVSSPSYASYNSMQIGTSTNTTTVYGEYTTVDYSAGNKYGDYKLMNTSASYSGTTYADYSYIAGSGNDPAYGYYSDLSISGSGNHFGHYIDISGGTGNNYGLYINNVNGTTNAYSIFTNNGNAVFNESGGNYDFRVESDGDANMIFVDASTNRVGIGTGTPTEELHVDGNAKATGYITAGTASTGSITRYGSQTFTYDTPYGYDADGYRYLTMATNFMPTGLTAITIRSIVWECDAAHEDGNEDHGLWLGIGASSATAGYYGWFTSVDNGYHYIDWHYVSDALSLGVTTANDNLYVRLLDEDGTFMGNDQMIFYNIKVTISYSYSVALQSGDIAASGRIYANNDQEVGDLAEHFEYQGPIIPGYLVSYVPGTDNEYVLCEEPYSNHITGVISENPSVVLNSSEVGPPLALAGRVSIKLVNSDELIKGGDFITSSAVAGYGMKATQPGPVIGYAVKNQKPGEDFVEILLQPGKFYVPPKYMDFDDRPDANDEKVNENYREPGGGAKQIGKTKN